MADYSFTFGQVTWGEDDIENALDIMERDITQEAIDKVRRECEAGRRLESAMIETGWDVIYSIIDELDLPPRN